jgi:GDP-L-fucose synthase
LPALLRRFVAAADSDAAEVVVWGSGKPRREFLFVDDLAEAAVMLMQRYDDGEIINIGCGTDSTIAEIASTVAEVTGFSGEIRFDTSMPDGTPQKLLDIAPIRKLGWAPRTSLTEGLRKTLHWYREKRS